MGAQRDSVGMWTWTWTWLTWAARVEFLESILAVIGSASGVEGGLSKVCLVTSSGAVQHNDHSHTRAHTKETGGGEESEEESSGVK